jgi:beta-1,4-mannosyltransferase
MTESAGERLAVLASPAYANHRNPYTALLYGHLAPLGVEAHDFLPRAALARRYDLVHVHWPERPLFSANAAGAAVKTVAFLALLALARARGARLVWTVHNLASHDQRFPGIERRLWRSFLPQVDGVISLSRTGLGLAHERMPRLASLPSAIIPIGSFRDAYPATLGRGEARRRLAVPDGSRVLAFVGQVRPYKNLPALIRAFLGLADDHAVLLVAGAAPDPREAHDLTALAAGDRRIRLALDFVSEEDMQVYLKAADLVVLPYAEILNSGAAILALDFARPLLLPHLGAMAELAATVGGSWVRTYEGPLESRVLSDALAWACGTPRGQEAPQLAPPWPELAAETLALYRAVLAAR